MNLCLIFASGEHLCAYPSQDIFNVTCRGLVSVVDIGGIVDHHCLNFLLYNVFHLIMSFSSKSYGIP